MKRSLILLLSFLLLGFSVPSAAAAADPVPAVSLSIQAVTEAYMTRFTISARDPLTGQTVPILVRLSNQPADLADNDYFVDYAAGPDASLPYGSAGWSDLAPGAMGTPFSVNGPTPIAVLAYDNEALGDPDGNDTGQEIGLSVAVALPGQEPGPWIAIPALPVVPATLTAQPSRVQAGEPTAVTFTLTNAAGLPLAGYSVQPEVQALPKGVTNAAGQVTLSVDGGSVGPLAFWAEDDADNGQNMAGIQYAGAYATATLDVVAHLPPPKPHPEPRPHPHPKPGPHPKPRPKPHPVPPPPRHHHHPLPRPRPKRLPPPKGKTGRRPSHPAHPSPPGRHPRLAARLVFLARNNLPYDGAVGSVLAVKRRAPLYVTDSREVVLLGGRGALTPTVAASLRVRGLSTRRIWGADRYGTASQVALAEGAKNHTAVVVSGVGSVGLLAAAGVADARGWPILLASPDGIPAVEQGLVGRLQIRRVYVMGAGPGLSEAVRWLQSVGVRVLRIGGRNPWQAEAAWVRVLGLHPRTLYLVRAGGFAAVIPMLPAVALHRSLVLTLPARPPIPAAIRRLLGQLGRKQPVQAVWIGGRPIPSGIKAQVARDLRGDP
jgi:hypothetical protein